MSLNFLNPNTIAQTALLILMIAEGLVLFLLYRLIGRGQNQKDQAKVPTKKRRPAQTKPDLVPETALGKLLDWVVLVFLVVLLPLIVFLALNQAVFKSLAQPTTLTTPPGISDPNPASETYLDQTWYEFQNTDHNFHLIYTKCLRPFVEPSPPFQGQAGWIFRCEEGKNKMELIVTQLSFTEAQQNYPTDPNLVFEEFSTPYFSGWKGLIENKTVYYFLERDQAKNGQGNILLIGHLDQFNELPGVAQLVVEHTAQSIRNLK